MDKFHSAWNSKEKNAVFIEYKKKMKAVVDEKEQRAFQWNEEICETYHFFDFVEDFITKRYFFLF